MRIPRLQFRHVAATLMVLGACAVVWQTARAFSAGATADKANNPRKDAGGVVQPPETCNKSGCHTPPTAGCDPNGKVEILGLPTCYEAGKCYDLSIKITDKDARRWGFEVGAQYNEGNQHNFEGAGAIDKTDCAGNDTQRTQKIPSADGLRSFITHQKASPNGDGNYTNPAPAALQGMVTYKFKWTAPGGTDRQTRVCFYFAGVAADNDSTRRGDCVYSDSACIEPCGATPTRRSSWGQVKVRYEK
ncbi:MAG: hypothetical protein HYR73_08685 [Candidatus Eisenbacteria bacterium]|nr:hypothetical protein [Candidatus Eisenbacteria bacterium]